MICKSVFIVTGSLSYRKESLGNPLLFSQARPRVSLCTSHRSSSAAPLDCRSSPSGENASLVWQHAAETGFPFCSILLHTRDPRARTSVPFSSVHSFILFSRNIEVEGNLRKKNQNSLIINHGSVLLTEHWFCVRHVHVWSHTIPIETLDVAVRVAPSSKYVRCSIPLTTA